MTPEMKANEKALEEYLSETEEQCCCMICGRWYHIDESNSEYLCDECSEGY